MTELLPQPPEEMPEHLQHFRMVDWMDDLDAVSGFDVWEHRRHFDRPQTNDVAILAAWNAFRRARAEWEEAHPEYVRRQIDEMTERRLRRRHEVEERWLQRLREEEGAS